MKQMHKFTASLSLMYLLIYSFTACNSQAVSTIDATSHKIDSLIEIQRVNEHCILIKFGSDAITALKTKKGIVVIDAGASSGLTAKYRKIIENEFQNNDFIYVINSHGHPDHYGGNTVFSESGIIGHVNCLQEISEQWNNMGKRAETLNKIVENYESQLKTSDPDTKEWNEIFTQKTKYLYAYYDAKNLIAAKQPDIIFSDSLTINMGDVTLEMIYFGKCHSNSDILIYVPEMAILFNGDLFYKYGRPSINGKLMKDNDRWQHSVSWIEKRMINIEKIIDGHGEELSIDDLKSFNRKILE
jgi:glyoxylase-like metal-dependent hydrolase (beta-lactamase superfamily II)